MHNYLLLIIVLIFSCQNKKEVDYKVNLNNKVLSYDFTKDQGLRKNNINFSDKGVEFLYKGSPSYIRVDSLQLEFSKGVNISFWFQFTGDNPKKEQMLFSVKDSLNPSKSISFWIAGRRLTGKINTNNLWAKEYDYSQGASGNFYDLFPLELGKYYFLSININKQTTEIFINTERYALYNGLQSPELNFDEIYFGVLKNSENNFKYQYQGYIRNLSIFNKILNRKEIEVLSNETYADIFPYNDEFELSKFKKDSFE
jgi:hypothetical protein